MRALLLAAGRGSRMTGSDRPKCLSMLAGRTLLDRQLAALRGGGASRVGIVRGFRAEMLERDDLDLFLNPRWSATNMVQTLCVASAWLREAPLVVSYGDIFCRRELVARLIEAPGDIVVAYDTRWRALWSRRFADPLADAETFRLHADGSLAEIGARAVDLAQIEGQYMGLVKWTPPAWQAAERLLAAMAPAQRDRLDMTGLLQRLLEQSVEIATVATAGGWGEADHPGDLALYEQMIQSGELRLDDDAPG